MLEKADFWDTETSPTLSSRAEASPGATYSSPTRPLQDALAHTAP